METLQSVMRTRVRSRFAAGVISYALLGGPSPCALAAYPLPSPQAPDQTAAPRPSAAASVTGPAPAPHTPSNSKAIENIVVKASKRSSFGPRIDPAVGATSYTIGQEQIGNAPGGSSATFQTLLLRLPGVVQDSYGEIHIRGEHGNAQYRINGIMLPDGLEGFGQEFNSRFVESATLVTGALPAQYGLKLSGVVDITTKTGADLAGGEIGVYGGSFGTIRPYFSLGGSVGKLDYFGNFTYTRNDLGIESPTSSVNALHDRTTQYDGFSGLTYQIDDLSKLTLLLGASNQRFQIPDVAGQAAKYALADAPDIPSSALNENQNEQRYFGVFGYELKLDQLTIRPAFFYTYDRILYTPDYQGDLIYQGVAGRTLNQLESTGPQIDMTYALSDSHLLAFGSRLSLDDYDRHDSNLVFPAEANREQTSDVPLSIDDIDSKRGRTYSFYVQDQWSLTPDLTLNYGLRYDNYQGYSSADQISPRVNAVYQVTPDTSVHLGYARYFTPPGLEFVTPRTVALFADTTNAASAPQQDPPYPERANYYDAGLLRTFGPLEVTVDGFIKQSKGGIDLGQFGNAVILVPFNYEHGHTFGDEISVTYAKGPWNAGLTYSHVWARAIGITSNQTAFPEAELVYIATHDITLDHDQPDTLAANGSYHFNGGNTKLIGDFLFGSGLRYGFANLGQLPPHYSFNAAVEHHIPLNVRWAKFIKLRFDVTNILDQAAELRAGNGVGIAAAQYLPRRGFFGTVAVDF